jgi:hypothetical protein
MQDRGPINHRSRRQPSVVSAQAEPAAWTIGPLVPHTIPVERSAVPGRVASARVVLDGNAVSPLRKVRLALMEALYKNFN